MIFWTIAIGMLSMALGGIIGFVIGLLSRPRETP